MKDRRTLASLVSKTEELFRTVVNEPDPTLSSEHSASAISAVGWYFEPLIGPISDDHGVASLVDDIERVVSRGWLGWMPLGTDTAGSLAVMRAVVRLGLDVPTTVFVIAF